MIHPTTYHPIFRKSTHPSASVSEQQKLNGSQVGEHVQLIGVTKTEYMYKYQGQERQDEFGLNWDGFKWKV